MPEFYSAQVRRTPALALVAVAMAACTSSPKATPASTSAPPTTRSFDSVAASSDDVQGAKGLLTLLVDGWRKADATLTDAEIACVPDAVLQVLSPQELFAVFDKQNGTLTPEQAQRVAGALRSCGFTDAQIAGTHLT